MRLAETALTRLRKAVAGRDIDALRGAIQYGQHVNREDSELKQELEDAEAVYALRQALDRQDVDALRTAIKYGETACLNKHELKQEFKEAEPTLFYLERKKAESLVV